LTKIEAVNIKKSFKIRHNGNEAGDGASQELVALDNVNISINTGEFLVILGPSGCGKSTFLDIIGGLSKPDEGTIHIDGRPIEGPGFDRGMVFQQYALFPWRTALGNVAFGLEAQNIERTEREKISQDYLALVGLRGFEDRYPYELSGGMKQRVAIARALAFNPEVLLMDEPFAALDAQTRETLQKSLLRINEETKKTIIFITHSIDEAVFLADRVAVMTARPGKIKRIVDVPIERVRRLDDDFKSTPEFIQTRSVLWKILKEEVERAHEICMACPVEECRLGEKAGGHLAGSPETTLSQKARVQ